MQPRDDIFQPIILTNKHLPPNKPKSWQSSSNWGCFVILWRTWVLHLYCLYVTMHHTNDDGNNQWKWARDAFVFVLALAVIPVPTPRGLPPPTQPGLAGYHHYSGYRSAADWHFIQQNLQHRPIFFNSLSRQHLIKPRVSFNICPFVFSTSGHFIMSWVQLPLKGREKSNIFFGQICWDLP